ncbi:MAG: murein biosynthesis integral membrane protein MurJ [Actinomycetota bacterium]|nr:murein biosynthesis integral membrane protein MurJ [Actinomycetota bacterium]
MSIGTGLSRITGLGRFAAMAFALGVTESRLADSYNIANTMPNVLYELALGGVLTSVFIPVVVAELRTREHDDAWEAASSLVATSMAVLVALTLVVVVAAPFIIEIFTLRLSAQEAAEQQHVATFFLRFFAPQIALYGFAAITGGLLNAHNRFAVPMFTPILNNLVVIASFLIFAAVVGGTATNASVSDNPGQMLLLALGTTGGVAAMAFAQWPFVRKLPGRLRVRINFRHPAVRKLARLSTWTIGYVAINMVGFGIALYLANQDQGGPTGYFTAFAFFQLPYGLAAVSIMTALVPTLAAQYVDNDMAGFRTRTAGGLRATAFLMVPATVAYLVLATPLIQLLLERGVMGGESTEFVSEMLAMFAIGLVPFAAFQLFMRAFYARQDAKTPMLVNIVENVATVALDFALFPSMGVQGLALAHSLGYVVGAVVAGMVLARRIGGLQRRHTTIEVGKVVVASAAAGVAMLAGRWLAEQAIGNQTAEALVEVIVGGGLGALVFLGCAHLLRVEDVGLLRRLLPRRLTARRSAAGA